MVCRLTETANRGAQRRGTSGLRDRQIFGLLRGPFGDGQTDGAYVVGQFAGRLVAVFRTLLQCLQDNPVQLRGDARIELRRRRRFHVQHRREDRHGVRSAERRASGQAFVQHRAQREQIALRPEIATLRLLRRHVLWSTQNGSGAGLDAGDGGVALLRRGLPLLEHFRQAEVQDFHLAALVDHDIGGFDVAVDNPTAVRFAQGGGHLFDHLARLHEGHGAVLQRLVQVLAAHQFHHQEGLPVGGFAIVVHLGDVGVVKR